MSKILVIDDEISICNILRLQLERDGHSVEIALNANEALNKYNSTCYDLIIVDIFIPEIDGLEIIDSIGKYSPLSKIIAMSGGGNFTMPSDLKDIEQEVDGVRAFLAKPITNEKLLASVKKVLGE